LVGMFEVAQAKTADATEDFIFDQTKVFVVPFTGTAADVVGEIRVIRGIVRVEVVGSSPLFAYINAKDTNIV